MPDAPLLLRLGGLVAAYKGWTYHRTQVGAAHGAGAMPLSVTASRRRQTNCSTFLADVVMALYPNAGWTSTDYGDVQVYADRLPDYPASMVRAMVRRGVGREVDGPMGGVHVVQGWVRPWVGHQMIVVDDDPAGRLLVIDANVGRAEAVAMSWTTLDALRERYSYETSWCQLR